MPRYNVTTYDIEIGRFTPQEGMKNPSQNVDIHGLRRALRELQSLGYSCHRGYRDSDPSVLVERNRGE